MTHYRFGYSDELPEPDVPETHPDYRFLRLQFREQNQQMKARVHAIIGISLSLQGVIGDEVLAAQGYEDIVEGFCKRQWNAQRGAKGEFWTLPEEIGYMNATLDTFIGAIKEVYGL
ncbi:hypothetical protein GOV09_02850 [Candidatus Woesearchaeota archaeon]|nr:hypothetical protein [Candidatus Woesearchaeota archaeon]